MSDKEIVVDGIAYVPKQIESKDSKINALEIGKSYFIRTCSYHYTGKVVGFDNIGSNYFVMLEDAAWIADSGRFANAIEDGIDKQTQSEIEPIKDIIARISINAIESIFPYLHTLPSKQK